jgi:hypothetical protein
VEISESKYFELLKRQIVTVMQQSYPGIPDSISNWKGQNIVDFQEDLRFKQNELISEKWFYNHMKSGNSKPPRIDILNFLSKYVGFKNWDEFKLNNGDGIRKTTTDKSNRVFYFVPLIMLVVLTLFYLIFKSMYTQEYRFCFYDNDTKKPVENSIIEISVLSNNESPVNYLCNKEGCFSIKTNKRLLKFVVKTPYYHTDTIVRILNKFNRTENVKLKIDDYAVMIQYFSNSNIEDWLKRRESLNEMFSDNAKIFQVQQGTIGMEMYNKWEFINKLTVPASSLRDIEVIDAQYNEDKITRLRFKQNE